VCFKALKYNMRIEKCTASLCENELDGDLMSRRSKPLTYENAPDHVHVEIMNPNLRSQLFIIL
jgi:hypothetical protein